MNQEHLLNLLESVRQGSTAPAEAVAQLRALPFADLGYAKVDHHRELRHGCPEVIFCPGKTADQVAGIVGRLLEAGQRILATRAAPEVFEHCHARFPSLVYHPAARIITNLDLAETSGTGLVLVVSAGTSDIPVAEEAAVTARACGAWVETIFDVGVAGLHRLLAHTARLQEARALVVCAGMEGALPSVVGGLVGVPVVAVPTSVGYGASFGGVAAMLGMLNSCASNVTVVNIDNGFGAGYVAALINRGGGSASSVPASQCGFGGAIQ